MKLRCTFEAVPMDDCIVYVPVGDSSDNLHGVLKLNESAYEIMEYLAEETTESEIVQSLNAKYDNDPDNIAASVSKVVQLLRENDLIIE